MNRNEGKREKNPLGSSALGRPLSPRAVRCETASHHHHLSITPLRPQLAPMLEALIHFSVPAKACSALQASPSPSRAGGKRRCGQCRMGTHITVSMGWGHPAWSAWDARLPARSTWDGDPQYGQHEMMAPPRTVSTACGPQHSQHGMRTPKNLPLSSPPWHFYRQCSQGQVPAASGEGCRECTEKHQGILIHRDGDKSAWDLLLLHLTSPSLSSCIRAPCCPYTPAGPHAGAGHGGAGRVSPWPPAQSSHMKLPTQNPAPSSSPPLCPPRQVPQRDQAAPKPFLLLMLLTLELLQMSNVTSCGLPPSFHPPWAADIRPPTPPSPHVAAFIPHSWAHFCLLPPASLNRPLLS